MQMQVPLVSSAWLAKNINEHLVILDASQAQNITSAQPKYPNKVIPNAIHVDLKRDFSDSKAPFPNTLLNESDFQVSAQNLGINANDTLVVYDNLGIYNSPRVWWMFKAMGHKEVYVLDGGLSAWIEAGNETSESHRIPTETGNFIARLNPNAVKPYDQVLANIDTKTCTLIDARGKGRFDGTAPEPREGMSSGHVPNSLNLPYTAVLNGEYMKPKAELEAIFDNLIKDDKPLIFSCGSGLTACIILLAAEIVSSNQKSVFDGSWTEWASTEGATIHKTSI